MRRRATGLRPSQKPASAFGTKLLAQNQSAQDILKRNAGKPWNLAEIVSATLTDIVAPTTPLHDPMGVSCDSLSCQTPANIKDCINDRVAGLFTALCM